MKARIERAIASILKSFKRPQASLRLNLKRNHDFFVSRTFSQLTLFLDHRQRQIQHLPGGKDVTRTRN